MPKLRTSVVVHRKGESHTFNPGDDLPAWAVDAITNPDAWDEPPAQEEGSTTGRRRSDSHPQTGSTPTSN